MVALKTTQHHLLIKKDFT